MFVEAIQKVDQFTRPIHFISRYYGGSDIVPVTATLFFVNEEGFAVTCRHVADQILFADAIYANFLKFKGALREYERSAGNLHRSRLEKEYGINNETLIRIRSSFVNCVTGLSRYAIHRHPSQDLAIIDFSAYDAPLYRGYAKFVKDSTKVKQGKYLCRLGYPFPEFTNFRYNQEMDDIEWTEEGRGNTPNFPIDGIVTRHVSEGNTIVGIEMSTPGLRGQSGGPLFDTDGVVYGMQSATRHLHLGFDQTNREVVQDGIKRRVSNYPFLSVGQCVHVNVIKDFLKEKKVKFYEE